jgi:hypothetical protein
MEGDYSPLSPSLGYATEYTVPLHPLSGQKREVVRTDISSPEIQMIWKPSDSKIYHKWEPMSSGQTILMVGLSVNKVTIVKYKYKYNIIWDTNLGCGYNIFNNVGNVSL